MALSSTTTATTTTSATSTHPAPVRRRSPAPAPSALQLLREHRSPEPEPVAPDPTAQAPAGNGFSARQLAALSAPLQRAHVQQREQGRSRLSYLEGWHVISEANRIFGFDGWQRQTLLCRCVTEHERTLGRDRRSGWGVTYIARVRLTITAGNRTLIREGSGAGHGIDADLGLAHESALKEAETDATKRALMTFGNPFGLALYDKQQRQVSSSAAPTTATSAALVQKDREAVADTPLEPAVIAALQERIKALAPARLEAFSRGFRAAFQVPDAVPSLAGLITTSRHQRWIEGFLAEANQPSRMAP